ncbi:MAG: thioesterase [Victivallales bacterium]|nr:thioesterase [Victivallales bacterium]
MGELAMQLFCFTFAGGTASFFDPLESHLGEGIVLHKLEYAGHGKRHGEPFYRDFEELSGDLLRQFLQEDAFGVPYAMFGYSMGSIACVEVLKKIVGLKLPLPRCVFLAAHAPCGKEELEGYSSQELDEIVKERTLAFGGVPEALANNSLFWRTYLPVYKADYTLIANYPFTPPQLAFPVPAIVFYSEQDTPYKTMLRWGAWFAHSVSFHAFDGNHFFIQHHRSEVARIIKQTLMN